MDKKIYEAPEMEVLMLVHNNALLSYSGGDPGQHDEYAPINPDD